MESRGETPPSHVIERAVEPLHAPDITLDRANHGRAVREEIMVAEEKEGVPRVVERQIDRVHHVWPVSRRPELPSSWDHLRPLGRSTACVGNQRMLVSRRDDPCESSVLDPGRIEEFLFADAVGEDRLASRAGKSRGRRTACRVFFPRA